MSDNFESKDNDDVVNNSYDVDIQSKLFDLICDDGELTWRSIILDLVKLEGLNPWDVDISKLTDRFVEVIKLLNKKNFRVSGKMVLASSILLNLKAKRLLDEDLGAFDTLMNEAKPDTVVNDETSLDFSETGGFDLDELGISKSDLGNGFDILDNVKVKSVNAPSTPKAVKRKISIYDLVDILERVLEYETKLRGEIKVENKNVALDSVIPKADDVDIGTLMINSYDMIVDYFEGSNDFVSEDLGDLSFEDSSDSIVLSSKNGSKLSFFNLVKDKLDVDNFKEVLVSSFYPLLFLETQKKIELSQEKHFSDILISLKKGHDKVELDMSVVEK